jgi:hypothetical protein
MVDSAYLGGYFPEITEFNEQAVLGIRYGNGDQQYCVLLCFSDRPEFLTVPAGAGTWRLRLNSAATRWSGPGATIPETYDFQTSSALTLPPISCVVFSREKD